MSDGARQAKRGPQTDSGRACPEEGERDFLVVTFMGLLGLNWESALELNHVSTALPKQGKGVVLTMPTVLLREFPHRVCQNEPLSECLHVASLPLEQLSDLKARLWKAEVSKDAYVIAALGLSRTTSVSCPGRYPLAHH
jgi:hypothetical protein